jgi:hypothetical protein
MATAGVVHAGQDAGVGSGTQDGAAENSDPSPQTEEQETQDADATDEGQDAEARRDRPVDSLTDNPSDPSNILPRIEERDTPMESLFSVSPLGWLREASGQARQDLYDATSLKLGLTIQHVFQGITDALPGQDQWGTASTTDLVAAWDLIDKGEPTVGQLLAHVQGRWDYGTTGPEDLGTFSLASVIGTADAYSAYTPTFILRNLFWDHGGPKSGWSYRVGWLTPDGILASSDHLASETTFLPSGGTGAFAIAMPDSGLGAAAAWYFSERAALVGLVSDANADRMDFGTVDGGDVFTAVELHLKIAPRTPKAGYSKLTLWHTDGTSDGQSANGQLGPEGWGFFLKHEQELTDDGRAILILRYGKSFNDSAVYEQQAAAHFLLYEPGFLTRLENDLVGIAFNWAKPPQSEARSEYNVEVFYRFPILPNVDTTLSYQSVIDPAFTRDFDHVSVFSLRIRTTF